MGCARAVTRLALERPARLWFGELRNGGLQDHWRTPPGTTVALDLGMSVLFRGVDALQHALDFHVSRHNVLASNLANAETPGFRPVEIVRDNKQDLGSLKLATTAEGHMANVGHARGEYLTREDLTVAPGANGNAVSAEHEMSKLAANDIRFEGAVKIVASKLAMLRYAANDGSG